MPQHNQHKHYQGNPGPCIHQNSVFQYLDQSPIQVIQGFATCSHPFPHPVGYDGHRSDDPPQHASLQELKLQAQAQAQGANHEILGNEI